MIAAYCARSWMISTWRTVGTRPITCPPWDAETLDLARLQVPLVYLRLHGLPDQPYLYGDDWQTALAGSAVLGGDFDKSLVFLEGCYGLEMAGAFLGAGAAAVVGSDRPTFGRRWRIGPSSRVGRAWIRAIKRGATAGEALDKALDGTRLGWALIGNTNARIRK